MSRTISLPTVPCRFCEKPTMFLGTAMCDPCWEVHNRLLGFDARVLGRIIRAVILEREARHHDPE